jgi:hypothetical protein
MSECGIAVKRQVSFQENGIMEFTSFDMGRSVKEAVQSGDRKRKEVIGKPMEKKSDVDGESLEASIERLTTRQKQYIVAYMETGSPTEVAKRLGLSGSPKGVGKKLTQIAKAMGLNGIRDLGVSACGNDSRATATQLKELVEKQGYKCALSGVSLSPETSQLDHVVALSDGGSNCIENLQWLDAVVNRAKGTMSQEDFVMMCVRVAKRSRRMISHENN